MMRHFSPNLQQKSIFWNIRILGSPSISAPLMFRLLSLRTSKSPSFKPRSSIRIRLNHSNQASYCYPTLTWCEFSKFELVLKWQLRSSPIYTVPSLSGKPISILTSKRPATKKNNLEIQ
jgi:hypothetical protein